MGRRFWLEFFKESVSLTLAAMSCFASARCFMTARSLHVLGKFPFCFFVSFFSVYAKQQIHRFLCKLVSGRVLKTRLWVWDLNMMIVSGGWHAINHSSWSHQWGFIFDSMFQMKLQDFWVVVSNIFLCSPHLGKISNLTYTFQMGWSHQLDLDCPPLRPNWRVKVRFSDGNFFRRRKTWKHVVVSSTIKVLRNQNTKGTSWASLEIVGFVSSPSSKQDMKITDAVPAEKSPVPKKNSQKLSSCICFFFVMPNLRWNQVPVIPVLPLPKEAMKSTATWTLNSGCVVTCNYTCLSYSFWSWGEAISGKHLPRMALFQSHSYLVPWRLSRVSPVAPVAPVALPRAEPKSKGSELLAVGTVGLATAWSSRKRRGRWLVTLNHRWGWIWGRCDPGGCGKFLRNKWLVWVKAGFFFYYLFKVLLLRKTHWLPLFTLKNVTLGWHSISQQLCIVSFMLGWRSSGCTCCRWAREFFRACWMAQSQRCLHQQGHVGDFCQMGGFFFQCGDGDVLVTKKTLNYEHCPDGQNAIRSLDQTWFESGSLMLPDDVSQGGCSNVKRTLEIRWSCFLNGCLDDGVPFLSPSGKRQRV